MHSYGWHATNTTTIEQAAEVFSSHPLQIRAAPSPSAAGVSPNEIRMLGRWSSSAYASYIRPSSLAY